MPYIDNARRRDFDEVIDTLAEEVRSEGEANYVISRFVNDILLLSAGKYGDHNAIIGVLECAKLELYRTVTAPYEDTKRYENGAIYEERATDGDR